MNCNCNTCRHLCRWSPTSCTRSAVLFSGIFCMVLDSHLDSVDDCQCDGEEYEEDK